jgi:hypothetical protein
VPPAITRDVRIRVSIPMKPAAARAFEQRDAPPFQLGEVGPKVVGAKESRARGIGRRAGRGGAPRRQQKSSATRTGVESMLKKRMGRRTAARSAVAILASVGLFTGAAIAAQDPASLIAMAKQASGGEAWDRIGELHERGALRASGLSGHYEKWIDLRGEREASRYDFGPSTGAEGWDGRRKWSVDSSGDVRSETSSQSVAGAVQDAYRDTFGFFFARRKASLSYAGARTADGRAYDAVKVSPAGAEAFELWLDRKTHLISREVQIGGDQSQTFVFSDWRRVSGALLPFRTVARTNGNPKFDQLSQVASIAASTASAPAGSFAPPREKADPAEWPAGSSSVTVPFQLINNHIYVRASIDGKPPADVIFDTGATDILERGHARTLGVAVEGALPIGGIGGAVASYGLAKVRSVSIGGVTLADQVFGAIDLEPILRVEDADFQGLVGYEFAKRAVLTIDYADRTLTFTKPDAFAPPSDRAPIPFPFREHAPIISAEVDGIAGQFELDTGARTGLMIMGPFAKEHQLAAKYRAGDPMTISYGVGGPSRARLARIGTLTMGGTTLKLPVAGFATGTSGDAASAHVAGNIGGDILKRFTVILDYPHQRLWLEPNALAAAFEPADRSGLWLSRAADGNIAVGDVANGSAAGLSGIRPGDEIVEVNGKPAAGLRLDALRRAFEGPAGSAFAITMKRGAERREVQLRLGSWIGRADSVAADARSPAAPALRPPKNIQ